MRELSTGHSRRHELVGLLTEPVITVPNHNTEDGITATRARLGVSWFDEEATRKGLARLRVVSQGQDRDCGCGRGGGCADAFRTGVVGIPLIQAVLFSVIVGLAGGCGGGFGG